MKNCTPITKCLACGEGTLTLTLDLGVQPLANNFRASVDHGEEAYPLAVNRCKLCDHLQLTHYVDPSIIYKHYLYVSGTTKTYVTYMKWYANFVRELLPKYRLPIVLDIGCNDGSQLDAFKEIGCSTWGVDPAENLHPISSAKHNVVCGFWDHDTIKKVPTIVDIITTQNAFAHIPNPLVYLQLAKTILRSDGLILISTSQADMVPTGEFDTIYHEHISYYNATSMSMLARRAGLYLIDVIKTPIHGTSYIFVLSPKFSNEFRMQNIIAMETASGLSSAKTYIDWANGVSKRLKTIKDTIDTYRMQGYHIVGYGAAAKGMTLINAAQLELDVVIDDNPLKQNTWCPGRDIPVTGIDYVSRITEFDKVLFVPLAWNFYSEIKNKIQAARNKTNDRFLRYFPKIEIE